MIVGIASTSATERFRQRFTALRSDHFRPLQDLWTSSLGCGTYLGDADDSTDALYAEALETALRRGCNLIDTAINYRCQRSERLIGRTLAALMASGAIARDELILCTKGGYLPFDGEVPADPSRYLADTIVTPGLASHEDIVGGCHCLAPSYLDHALRTSLKNLRVQTLDVYYLHNPEQQLEEIGRPAFEQRLSEAFSLLEQRAQEGAIHYYGVATWNGLRTHPKARQYLALEGLLAIAQRAGGSQHHFRVIQLPYNLAMPEAFAFQNQAVEGQLMTVLQAAQRLGLSVITSASLLQQQLTRLPDSLSARIPGLASPAQRALQFVRSTPGVTAALVGMKQRVHVEENLALAQHALMSPEQIASIFDRTRRS